MGRWARVTGVLAAGIVAFALATGPAPSEEKLKVGFVYVGPVGDAGWTYAHDQGRKYLEAHNPNVQTAAVENVAEGADSERVFTDLARKGYGLIVGTSFGYMDAMVKVASEFPKVAFVHISGFKRAKNLMTAFGRIEQPRYLTGLVAGAMTKTHIIGYVAAHPIPEVVRGINAFTLGVRATDPKATVHVVWSNTWYDPAQEEQAAESLLKLLDFATTPKEKSEVYRKVANIYLTAKKPEDAEKYFLEALKVDPTDTDSLQWLGEIASTRGGARSGQLRAQPAYLEKAVAYYDQVIAIDPGAVFAYVNKRIALLKYYGHEIRLKQEAEQDLQAAGRNRAKTQEAKAQIAQHDAKAADLKRQTDELAVKITELQKAKKDKEPAAAVKTN